MQGGAPEYWGLHEVYELFKMTQHKQIPEFSYTVDSMREVAAACGVSNETASAWYKLGLLERRPKGKRTYEYDLLAAVRYAQSHRLQRKHEKEIAKLKKQIAEFETAAGGGGTAEQIETRLRQERLELDNRKRKYEIAEMQRQLIPTHFVDEFLNMVATRYERAGDLLRQHHGVQAQQIVLDTNKLIQHDVETTWADIDDDHEHEAKAGLKR